jgi:Ser/Thr protein kinase RdoA (MazF antagonist)
MIEQLKELDIKNIETMNGFHNQIYKGQYNGIDIIIRVSERRSINEVQTEINLLNDLLSEVNIGEPIEVKGKNPLVKEWKTLSFFKYVSAKHWFEIELEEKHHFLAGQALGKIHKFSMNKNYKRKSYEKHPDIVLLKNSPKLIQDELNRILKIMNTWDKTSLNYGLVHGDYLFSNLLFTDEDIYVIDFDDIEMNFYLYDIAVYLFYLLLGANPLKMDIEPNIEVFKTFIKGYRSTNKDMILDMTKIQTMFRLRQLKLYATISQLPEEKLGQWQKNFIKLTERQIKKKIPFIDIDYHKLYKEIDIFSL